MLQYITKRLLLMIPTLIGAAIFVFFLLRAIPGDICALKLEGGGLAVDQKQIDLCRMELGLHLPLIVQFWNFVVDMVTFDFGESMWTGRPITQEIGLRFELSLQVAIMATLTSVIIALPLGTISAVYQNTWIDLCRANVLNRGYRHSLILARHPDPAGHPDIYTELSWQGMDAANRVQVAVG